MGIEDIKRKTRIAEERQEDNVRAKKQLEDECSFFGNMLHKERQLDESCLSLLDGHQEQYFFEMLGDDRLLQEKKLYDLADDSMEQLNREGTKLAEEIELLHEEELEEKRRGK